MKTIHASCVVLDRAGKAFAAPRDAGILILGESGAGKSELVLQLIANGAMLVADDRVELSARNGKLLARAPKMLAGLVELRGVGIVKMPHKREAKIALVVRLANTKIARLPDRAFYDAPVKLPQAARLPLVTLTPGAALPAKIAATAAAFARNRFGEEVKET